MLFKWKGANKKSHQKWDFIVYLVLWLVKQRVTWPFPGDFWRKTTTNHHETTTENHYEPPRTTTNHHEPPQSLIQNEIWYWILDSDWLNSGSHDIFLRILEKNYHKPPQTTTNHHEPPRTTMNHHEPLRTTMNHYKPWQWTMTWTTTVNHNIWTTMNHNEPWRNRVFRRV